MTSQEKNRTNLTPPRIKRQRFVSKIIAINDLTPTVKKFILSVPNEFIFYAGQFITLRFKMTIDGKEKTVGRAYSIASPPYNLSNTPADSLANSLTNSNMSDTPKTVELCIKLVEDGVATPALFSNPPSEINVVGPMGNFFLTPKHKEKDLVFIATGTGIAPFKSMIEQLLLEKHQHALTLLTGVRHEKEILYPDLWKIYKKIHPKLKYESIVSRPQSSKYVEAGKPIGRVTDLLVKHINSKKESREQLFIICGLTPMIDSVQEILLAHNVKSENILFEKYD